MSFVPYARALRPRSSLAPPERPWGAWSRDGAEMSARALHALSPRAPRLSAASAPSLTHSTQARGGACRVLRLLPCSKRHE